MRRARTGVRHSVPVGVTHLGSQCRDHTSARGWKRDMWGDGGAIPCPGTPHGVTSPRASSRQLDFQLHVGYSNPGPFLSSALSGDLIPWSDPAPIWFSWRLLLKRHSCSGLNKPQDCQDLKYFFWFRNLCVQCGVERKE